MFYSNTKERDIQVTVKALGPLVMIIVFNTLIVSEKMLHVEIDR